MAISVKKLNHVYDEKSPFAVTAIRDVDLEIADGEFVCVIGHTGSGKSTLVQHLNGSLKATSAEEMLIENIDLCQKKPDWKTLRQRVGMVFQYPEYQLFEQTVYDDIAFGPKNLGWKEEKIRQCVKESMALVGLSEELEQASPFELSGGQKRRVAIAGVLSMEPAVLVLDEPIAGLDPRGKQEILDVIDRYQEQKKATVIMISHNMDDIAERADRVIVMDHGRKLMDGSPEQVFSRADELLACGLDLPVTGKIVRELNCRGAHIPARICRMDELASYLREGKQ